MKAIVVVESGFGNTRVLAQDVRDGLAEAGADVALVDPADAAARELVDCDLVVLAAARAAKGIQTWLVTLDKGLTAARPRFAVLDTRVNRTRRWRGTAAGRETRTLRRAGFTVLEQTIFYVEDTTGPVVTGEHHRARVWGRHLAEVVHLPAA